LRKDGRWQYGTPPTGNANYAWIQHFIYHLINKISLVRLRSLEPLERAPLVRLRLKNQREAGIWVLRNNLAGRLTMQSIKPNALAASKPNLKTS
jgi:hypothetical protein